MKATNKSRNTVALFLFGTIIIFLAFFIWSAASISQYASEHTDQFADVAIVLGAGSSQGKISPVFRERCHHAIELFFQKQVRFILLTGGYGPDQTISDSKAAAEYLVSKNVPREVILLEEVSTHTIENLIEARAIMLGKELRTARIISDPLHMKRSMAIAARLSMKAFPSPTPSSMYRSEESKRRFLIREAYFYCQFLVWDQWWIDF